MQKWDKREYFLGRKRPVKYTCPKVKRMRIDFKQVDLETLRVELLNKGFVM
jgi:hypothetical protein